MTTSDKLREIAELYLRDEIKVDKLSPIQYEGIMRAFENVISEHYYTREFLLWFHDNVQIESQEETFLVYNDIRFYTLNEVREFWQRVQEKKEYVKRKKNEQ